MADTLHVRRPSRRAQVNPGTVALYCTLVLGAVVMAAPFAWMLLTALKSPAEVTRFGFLPKSPQWGNFAEAMRAAPFGRYLRNSLIVAVGETAFSLVVCTMAGYALAQLPLRRGRFWLGYFVALIMIPFQLLLVPLFIVVKSIPLAGGNDILGQGGTGWLDTWWGLIIPLGAAPFFTFLARQFYVSVPREIADAARVDGAGEFMIFLRIMTPLARPALITMGVIQLEQAWNAFLWPLMITSSDEKRPVQLGLAIFSQVNGTINWPVLMAGTSIAALPMIALFMVAQRYFVSGIATSGLKG